MRWLAEKIHRVASFKWILILSFVALSIVAYFTTVEHQLHQLSTDIMSELPNLPIDYVTIPDKIIIPKSADFLYQQVAWMGVEGRNLYLTYNLVDTLCFQVVMCILESMLISLAWNPLIKTIDHPSLKALKKLRRKRVNEMYWRLMDLPFIQLACDTIENGLIRWQVTAFPERIDFALNMLVVVTFMKWLSFFAALAAAAYGYLLARTVTMNESVKKKN